MFHDSISDKTISGTTLFPPDESIQEQCERDAYDVAFDVYMRRRSGEIEKLIAADAKLDADWLADMRRKADKLSGIIRLETWIPQPVSPFAPVQVIARDRIRRDKLAGIVSGNDLKLLAKGKRP